ncbi:MAG: hypothetical protein DI582_00375 [Azospirillum brasilense]|nr:MAG: hypothetical protein DI582_00375 [Azospirillum brasilense]
MDFDQERLGMAQEQPSAMPDYATIWLAVLIAVVVVSGAALLLGQPAMQPVFGDPYEASVGMAQETPAP